MLASSVWCGSLSLGYLLGLCLWLVVALLSFCLRGDIAEFGVVVRSAWLICLRLVVVSPLLQCRCGSVEFGLSMVDVGGELM